MNNKEKFGRNGVFSLIVWNVVMFGIAFMARASIAMAFATMFGAWFGVIFWYALKVNYWLFPEDRVDPRDKNK